MSDVDIYAGFVDYKKAVVKVRHNKLMSVLEKIGVDAVERRIIINLYWQQSANVKIDNVYSINIVYTL